MGRIEINKKTRKQNRLVPDVKMELMYKVLLILPISMLIFAFLCNTPTELLEGTKAIWLSDDILVTDYFEIANIGAAFLNAASVMLLNIALLYALKLKPNGIIISALFLLGGFAFMGKNPYNIWPFYLGGYVYSRYHKLSYKSVVVINMLSTALSPLSSFIIQGVSDNLFVSLAIAAVVSGTIGFIMPTISTHMLSTHMGYSLYNMGAAVGFVGMILYSIMICLGFETERTMYFYTEENWPIVLFFIVICIVYIVVGYYLNEKTFKGYRDLMRHSGRLVTDMIKQDGFGLSFINMGMLGLISLLYVYAMGGVLNGPIIAGVFTVMGFGTFGKHPRNIMAVMLGVTLGMSLMQQEVALSVVIMSALFGTTLAPIAGEYGALWGILAGLLHAALVLNIGGSHGGIVLYNNGLAGGIIAMILIPTIDAFKREKKHETRV